MEARLIAEHIARDATCAQGEFHERVLSIIPYLTEATDEIARLRAANKNRMVVHEAEIRRLGIAMGVQADEIGRLRAALDDCISGRKDWIEKAKAALKDT